jgi:hypothetical protein
MTRKQRRALLKRFLVADASAPQQPLVEAGLREEYIAWKRPGVEQVRRRWMKLKRLALH